MWKWEGWWINLREHAYITCTPDRLLNVFVCESVCQFDNRMYDQPLYVYIFVLFWAKLKIFFLFQSAKFLGIPLAGWMQARHE